MQAIMCFAISSIVGNAISLDDLIKRHEEGLSLIRSIKAKIELRVSEDGGKTWKTTLEYAVMRSGETERYNARYYYVPSSGYSDGKILTANMFKDFLTTPEGRRTIVYAGLDPEDTPSGTIDVGELESTGRKISGQIDPPQPFGPLGYKSFWITPLLFAADLRFTMRELCAGSRPIPIQGKHAGGETSYDLDVSDPTSVRRYLLSFDPSHNYLIRNLKTLDSKGKPLEWFSDLSVVDFQEPKKGIFVPKMIRGSSHANPERIYEVEVSDVVVNEPFEDEKLRHLEFPPGIVVLDTTQENCFHIWGDGKPAMTFRTPEELNHWRLEKMTSFVRRSRYGGWTERAFWLGGATLVLVGVLWIRHMVLRRSKTA